MNRSCIVLTILFSINLTTSDFVSADDRAQRNGIKLYRDAMQKLKVGKKRSSADDLFKRAIKSLEAALEHIEEPRPKAVVHLRLGISKYEYRRGSKKEAATSLKLALKGDWLDAEQRADAHLYLAMSLLALGEKAAQENFKQAFRQNPNIEFPSWRKDDTTATNRFYNVQKAVTGTLTITLSPPETENWTISIDGKKLDRDSRNAVVSQDGLRLYKKNEYNVQGIYKGESIEKIVTIEPNLDIKLEILPLTVEHEPPSSADAGQEIALTIYVSRNKPRQVKIYYKKTGKWRFTPEILDDPPVRSADKWTYKVNLPSQNFVGEIEYYIEAEYTDSSPVRHPEKDFHQIAIVDNTRPTIKTVKTNPSEVNQSIKITAEVRDNISVKEVKVHYAFSPSNESEPSQHYSSENLTKNPSGRYTGYISAQSHAGYIRYYVTATDEEGNESQSEEERMEIVELSPSKIDLLSPPKIDLLSPPNDATFNVNELITIKARVTDNTSVKEVFVHFSPTKKKRLSKKDFSNTYTIGIRVENAGSIQYHLTATDEEENESQSEVKQMEIVEPSPPEIDIQSATSKIDRSFPSVTPLHQGIWANYAWSNDVFENSDSISDWDRGDVLSLAYLREGKTHWTLSTQLDFSYQNPAKYDNSLLMRKVSNASATVQWGPALGENPIAFTFIGGVAGYRSSDSDRLETKRTTHATLDGSTHITPILGAGLKLYLQDRVSIDATSSIKLRAVDTLADGESSFAMRRLYHYDIGIRVYIVRALNLRGGYGRWYLGDRSTTGVQIGLGVTF